MVIRYEPVVRQQLIRWTDFLYDVGYCREPVSKLPPLICRRHVLNVIKLSYSSAPSIISESFTTSFYNLLSIWKVACYLQYIYIYIQYIFIYKYIQVITSCLLKQPVHSEDMASTSASSLIAVLAQSLKTWRRYWGNMSWNVVESGCFKGLQLQFRWINYWIYHLVMTNITNISMV